MDNGKKKTNLIIVLVVIMVILVVFAVYVGQSLVSDSFGLRALYNNKYKVADFMESVWDSTPGVISVWCEATKMESTSNCDTYKVWIHFKSDRGWQESICIVRIYPDDITTDYV